MDRARKTAFDTLLRVLTGGAYSNLALSAALDGKPLSEQDSAFASALVYTTVERLITIDDHLSRCLKQPLRKLHPQVQTALRMGAAQILFMDRVPDGAAVNESVKLVQSLRAARYASGLVNAVLRKVALNGLQLPDGGSDENRSVRYSCPEWLVRLWSDAYGADEADKMMASALGGTAVTVRVNTTKCTATELAGRLAEEGVSSSPVDGLPDALRLDKCGAPEKTAAFREGLFHVQDASSQYCCAALDVQPGQTIYDVCAAPGGKTFTIAEMLQNSGTVEAFDLYPQRVGLIEQGASRLGLSNVRASVCDASVPDNARKQADRVLCDVPCAGLGVIGKKPEIRFKKQEDIDKLPELQYNILCISSAYVRKGGILVYSTCSLNPRENEEVVRRFLSSHPSFHTLPILPGVDAFRCGDMCSLLPHRTHSDGFFITALTETE